jgi:hypothetical protein
VFAGLVNNVKAENSKSDSPAGYLKKKKKKKKKKKRCLQKNE